MKEELDQNISSSLSSDSNAPMMSLRSNSRLGKSQPEESRGACFKISGTCSSRSKTSKNTWTRLRRNKRSKNCPKKTKHPRKSLLYKQKPAFGRNSHLERTKLLSNSPPPRNHQNHPGRLVLQMENFLRLTDCLVEICCDL